MLNFLTLDDYGKVLETVFENLYLHLERERKYSGRLYPGVLDDLFQFILDRELYKDSPHHINRLHDFISQRSKTYNRHVDMILNRDIHYYE